jgi:hypothetical protein
VAGERLHPGLQGIGRHLPTCGVDGVQARVVVDLPHTSKVIGNTQGMVDVPAPNLYHRWVGWHAPAMRRALTVLVVGLIAAVVLLPFVSWELAVVGGWDATALSFLLVTWSIIIRADGPREG